MRAKAAGMFMVDEETTEAIRSTWHEDGELSAIVELRRHLPLIKEHATASRCVRTIVGVGSGIW